MPLKTSSIGRAVLTAREGCRLAAYQDGTGVWTIGIGHTGRATPTVVKAGMSISQAEADAYLEADLVRFEAAVNHAIALPMSQNQFDAMVSLAFNIGAAGFEGSTVVHKFNAQLIQAAADAFLMWERPASLKSRREAERAQFLTSYGAALPSPRSGEPPIKTPTAPPLPPASHIDNLPRSRPGLMARFKAWWVGTTS